MARPILTHFWHLRRRLLRFSYEQAPRRWCRDLPPCRRQNDWFAGGLDGVTIIDEVERGPDLFLMSHPTGLVGAGVDTGVSDRGGLASLATPTEVPFGEWVRPHLTAMANLAARMSRAENRDDIVQEALTRAWKRRSTYDPGRGSPRAWLLAIVADQARRAHRRMRLTLWVPRPAVQESPTADGLDLERAISRLPRRQRLAVDLYYFVDLDIAETAAVMGCAPGTVKSTLADARARLRQALEER